MNIATGVRFQSVDQEREAKKAISKYLEEKVKAGQVAEVNHFFARGLDKETIPEDLKIVLQGLKDLKRSRKTSR